jgi:hypothetical protein
MTNFDPEKMLEILARHRVDHVLIGGYAAILQASPFLTHDIDVTP